MTLVRVNKKQKNTDIKLYANQVMLLVIRLTMKKSNITKLLQHYSSQWLVAGQYQKKKHIEPNIKGAIICKKNKNNRAMVLILQRILTP